MSTLTLNEFIAEQKEHLEKFEKHWREKHAANSVAYPDNMYSGDWDEQLAIFSDGDTGSWDW